MAIYDIRHISPSYQSSQITVHLVCSIKDFEYNVYFLHVFTGKYFHVKIRERTSWWHLYILWHLPYQLKNEKNTVHPCPFVKYIDYMNQPFWFLNFFCCSLNLVNLISWRCQSKLVTSGGSRHSVYTCHILTQTEGVMNWGK